MSIFISIEGFDGTGKSTQAKLLKENLKKSNIDSKLVREPGSTDFSEKIRDILRKNTEIETITELLLFQASRSELVNKVIKPNNYFRLFATANTVGLGDTTGLYTGTQQIKKKLVDVYMICTI